MKKICLIDYNMSVTGGVEQVTASLANALADTYEVWVADLCSDTEAPAYILDPRVHYVCLLRHEARLRQMRKELLRPLVSFFRDNEIDVAIIQGNYPGFLASAARGRCRTKLIFCDHGALMNQWNQKDIVLIRLISSLLCHRVVTLTEQSRNDYIRRFFLPRTKVCCIYNWLDNSGMSSKPYDASSRKIISAGRFGKEKGFDNLVRAFAKVSARHPDWRLDIFGDGEMMPAVKELVARYSLQDVVSLPGMCSDLASRYPEYAMYVLPSHREGMPLVLLEAKGNRLPIVSFDVLTGPREIIRDGVDGILVPPEDIDALAAAMDRLMGDDALRQEMSDRSQENLEKFSKDTILNQWIALIERLTRGKRS